MLTSHRLWKTSPLVVLLLGAVVACGSGASGTGDATGSDGGADASRADGAHPSDGDGTVSGDAAAGTDATTEDAAAADGSGGSDASAADATSASDGPTASTDAAADAGVHDAAVPDASAVDAGTGEGPLSGIDVFPAPGSTGVCPDPPLRLTFASPPKLGTAGRVQVFNASKPGTAVAAVDMAATTLTDTIGGTTFNIQRPAYVDGNDAVVYLPSHALTYGQTYYMTVDAGAIVPPTGTFSVTGTTTWRFSTAAAAPTNLSTIRVALDGSGSFCSVQGAADAVPTKNTSPVTVSIASGIYHEIIHFSSRNNVTLLGDSRTGTIIEGVNNNDMNPTTSTRSLVGIDGNSGLVIDTMTISNLTPQGGSQAEALRLETCDECIVRNANVNSLQDTLLWDGRLYADNCTIAGNVDFVWGGGTAYFNNCHIKTVVQAGAVVQARNPASTYGYVFVDSQLTSDTGITGQVLARIDVSMYPASNVAYINCQMGSFISPEGWTITGGTDTSQLRFWEYESVDSTGKAIDVSKRVAGSMQLSATQAAQLRDPSVVLAGWTPP